MKTEFLKSSIIVTIMSGLRMLLGIISQMFIAYYFGTSRELDIFFIVLAIPSLISGIVISLFSSSIIPELTPIKDCPEKLERAVSSIFLYVSIMSLVISLNGIFLGDIILRITTDLSFKDIIVAYKLAEMIWVIIGFEIILHFLIALFHLEKRFVVPSVFLFFPAIGMIYGTVFLSGEFGISGLVAGWLCMNIFSCLILLTIIIKQYGASIRKIKVSDPYALAFLKSLVPISISILPFTILPSLDAYWVSGLEEGSMSYIGYSTKIALALATMVINGIYTVILPYLSENVKAKEEDKILLNLSLSIKSVLFILIPVVVFCLFYSEPILKLLFERGQFDSRSLKGILDVLPFYLIGTLAMGPSTLISRAYFARKMFKQLSAASIILIFFYFELAGILINWFSYVGIGVTYTTYWFFYFFITTLIFDRKLINRSIIIFIAKVAGNSFISVGISYYIYSNISLSPFIAIILSGLLSVGLFYLMNRYFFRTLEILKLAEIINLKKKKFYARL